MIGIKDEKPYHLNEVRMRFQIWRAINNIFLARSIDDGRMYTARIKGKVLRKSEAEYSAASVGDIAAGEPYSDTEALLTSLEERRSAFVRWNAKREMNQTIAANQDMTAIVVSPSSPPFRPRFLDRAIACSHGADILIILNKSDEADDAVREAISGYARIGFRTIAVSSATGEGLEDLRSLLEGRITAFVGQSGVGKSTLINTLMGTEQRTAGVSEKYNRGRHTTNHSLLIERGGISLIDTPGVREIEVPFEDESLVMEAFPELSGCRCLYPGCLHHGEEGCIVPDLAGKGGISEDRYTSYLRILESIESRRPIYQRKRGYGNR